MNSSGFTERHLRRRAAVYIRQSSLKQARNNTGSTEYQRNQVRHAIAAGWPKERIDLIDDDRVSSGASASHRDGYLQLKEAIERNEIGAIFMSHFNRMGRNSHEWSTLLGLCRNHRVLIVTDGEIHDPRINSERLFARIITTIGEYENDLRREQMEQGKIAKIGLGETVSLPPCGYVRLTDRSWIKHSSPEVQAAVQAVFRTFLEVRSCPKTVRVLRARNIRIPKHNDRTSIVKWAEATLAQVYRMLRNPAYVGDYTYRRTIADPVLGENSRGHFRTRRADPDEQFICENNHEPYVSREDWNEIQAILTLNGPSEKRRNLGPGSALLQGIIRCAIHKNHSMVSVYKNARRDGQRCHSYSCIGTAHDAGQHCGHYSGPQIDRVVLEAILERLEVPRLKAVGEELHRVRDDLRSEEYRRKVELQRHRREVDDLEHRYCSVDTLNVNVKETLENRLEAAKKSLKDAERNLKTGVSPLHALADDAFEELVDLCRDLRGLLHADTTTHQDRKQLGRILIEQVSLIGKTSTHFQFVIHWRTGWEATRFDVPRKGFANELIAAGVAAGKGIAEIVDDLNRLDLRNLRGTPWTFVLVRNRLQRLQRNRGADRR